MISRSQLQSILLAYAQQLRAVRSPGERSRETSSQESADRVVLSADSEEVRRIAEYIRKLPDVREDKVAKVQAMLREGRYRVSGREIAERMLERMLADRLR